MKEYLQNAGIRPEDNADWNKSRALALDFRGLQRKIDQPNRMSRSEGRKHKMARK